MSLQLMEKTPDDEATFVRPISPPHLPHISPISPLMTRAPSYALCSNPNPEPNQVLHRSSSRIPNPSPNPIPNRIPNRIPNQVPKDELLLGRRYALDACLTLTLSLALALP